MTHLTNVVLTYTYMFVMLALAILCLMLVLSAAAWIALFVYWLIVEVLQSIGLWFEGRVKASRDLYDRLRA